MQGDPRGLHKPYQLQVEAADGAIRIKSMLVSCAKSEDYLCIPHPRDNPFTASPAPSISLSSPSAPLRVRGMGRRIGLTSPKEGRSIGLEVKLIVPIFTCRVLW